jgi:TPR repeat protein
LPPLEQARRFLRDDGSAAAALALSRTLPQTQEGRDAAYLLLEAAAEQDQPEAMLDLAALYDPLDAHPRGSIRADAEQAWEWYGKAEKAGQTTAAERKRALRAWLEAEAGKGSAEAKDILSRIR